MQSHPFSKPFFFRVKHVRYEEDPSTPPPEGGAGHHWLPSKRGRFIENSPSRWWVWDPGPHQPQSGLRRVRQPTADEVARFKAHRTCTMIWDPERHGYIQVPIDCTTTSWSSTTNTWRRLEFGRGDTADRAHIALIGHQRDGSRLHLPAPSHWFEQLLPDVCKSETDGPPDCRLAGHLSILVGLVAFSATPQYTVWAIDQSFRYDVKSTVFRPNPLPKSPTHQKRTMVVEIGYASSMVNVTDLHAWEEGKKGEIFS